MLNYKISFMSRKLARLREDCDARHKAQLPHLTSWNSDSPAPSPVAFLDPHDTSEFKVAYFQGLWHNHISLKYLKNPSQGRLLPDTAHQRCYVLLIQLVLLKYTDLLLIYSLEYLDTPVTNRETELIPVDLDATHLVDAITHSDLMQGSNGNILAPELLSTNR